MSIQIMRSRKASDRTSSTKRLDDGQLLYDKELKQLYIGDGSTEARNLAPITAHLQAGSGADSIQQSNATNTGDNSLALLGAKVTGNNVIGIGSGIESESVIVALGKYNKTKTSAIMCVGCGTDSSNTADAFVITSDKRAQVFGAPTETNDVIRRNEYSQKYQDYLKEASFEEPTTKLLLSNVPNPVWEDWYIIGQDLSSITVKHSDTRGDALNIGNISLTGFLNSYQPVSFSTTEASITTQKVSNLQHGENMLTLSMSYEAWLGSGSKDATDSKVFKAGWPIFVKTGNALIGLKDIRAITSGITSLTTSVHVSSGESVYFVFSDQLELSGDIICNGLGIGAELVQEAIPDFKIQSEDTGVSLKGYKSARLREGTYIFTINLKELPKLKQTTPQISLVEGTTIAIDSVDNSAQSINVYADNIKIGTVTKQ